uniref:Uncharacterized protein n=1 Tax=Arundo donax TaxID=35708 RepID=A0A0A9EYJ8_ARUDO
MRCYKYYTIRVLLFLDCQFFSGFCYFCTLFVNACE